MPLPYAPVRDAISFLQASHYRLYRHKLNTQCAPSQVTSGDTNLDCLIKLLETLQGLLGTLPPSIRR